MQRQKNYRDRYDILRNVLYIVANTQAALSQLYEQDENRLRASLTHLQVVDYLGQLLASGLLVKMEFKPFYSYYEITKRGRRCLELFDELEDDMRPSPSANNSN